jgi:hypothetical protein
MADPPEKQEYTNEGDELVTLYDGTPIFPGRTVKVTQQQVDENPGVFESDALTKAKSSSTKKETKSDA